MMKIYRHTKFVLNLIRAAEQSTDVKSVTIVTQKNKFEV